MRRQTLRENVYKLANVEEQRWLQRSRCQWLKEGDGNTRYFHMMASARAQKNAVTALEVEGRSITKQAEIKKAFFQHIKAQLGTNTQTAPFEATRLYPTGPDLSGLAVDFIEEEVHSTIKGLATNRASGPDGLTNEFLQKYWAVMKVDIIHMFERLQEGNLDLKEVNCANVIMLRKSEMSFTVNDYRPISIINLIPKVLSKVLSNRLSGILPELISKNQTAFIQGRFIAENFIATRELLHHVSRSRRPTIFSKIDFNKAFDSIEWGFLIEVMRARSFPVRWIGWIKTLLETASTRILINGEATDYFKQERGLRQGDPISPMLFILAINVLQQMVRVLNENIKCPISEKVKEALVGLQYADDTVFIANGDPSTLIGFKLLLRSFMAISGLKINFAKSSMVPFNMQQGQIRAVEAVLGCQRVSLPITYLGMPMTITAPKRADYLSLIEKLERRLHGWQTKLISRGGRLQLARSVLSALPIYYMTCFRLPQWVTKRIDALRRGFLWGKNQGTSKGLSLMNWDSVCMPKEYGGMGLLDIDMQNISLLLRWWWRPNTELTAMWTIVIMQIKVTRVRGVNRWNSGGSFFWKGMLKILPWFVFSTMRDGQLLKWNWVSNGIYSSRSFYFTLKTGGKEKWPFKEVWLLKAPPIVRVLTFLLLQGRLLTRDVLQIRNIQCPTECVLCSTCSNETAMHLFFTCSFAKKVWGLISRRMGYPIVRVQGDVKSTWTRTWSAMRLRGKEGLLRGTVWFVSSCWQIWLMRNNLIFRGERLPPEGTAMKAVEIGTSWLCNC